MVFNQLQLLSQRRYASTPTAEPPKQIPRRIRSQAISLFYPYCTYCFYLFIYSTND